MKKITLFLAFCAFSFGYSQNGGDTCGTAVQALPGSFTATQINVGTQGGEGGGAGAQSSAWFYYDATADGTIDVSSCDAVNNSDTRLYIGVGTCGALTMVTDDDGCGTLRSLYTDYPVINGTRYYIEWDDRWGTGGDPFDWSLTFNAPPACGEPTNLAIDGFTDVQADFSWDAPAFGTVTDYDWEIVPQGDGQGVNVVDSGSTVATSASSVLLVAGTDYDLFVRTDCGDPPASNYVGPISFTTLSGPPPANDLCAGALVATQETSIIDAASATPIAGTIANGAATDDSSDCFGGGNPNDDVWYSFTALTADVNITVAAAFDTVITLYSTTDDTCGTITELSCEDTVFPGGGEELGQASGLNIGAVYYFRIYQYGTGIPADPTFTYKLWSSTTLSTEQFEDENTFTYFPNPVKDKLTLKAHSNIQNISVYNMLGQEVIRTAPNAIRNELSMSSLRSGAYFVKVTINNVTETIRIIKQ